MESSLDASQETLDQVANDDLESQADAGFAKRTAARRPNRLIIAGSLIAVGIYLAPWLIGMSPFAKSFIASAVGPLEGDLNVGAVSLGWLSSPQVAQLELRDREGNVVLSAQRVVVGKTLLGLAFNSSDLGEIRVDDWKLDLEVGDSTTNLEQVLEPLLSQESTSPTPRFQLTASNGTCAIRSQGSEVTLSGIEATVLSRDEGGWELSVEQGAEDSASRILVTGQLLGVDQAQSVLAGAFDVEAESLPLQLVTVLMPRFGFDWRASGTAAVKGKLEFEQTGSNGHVSVEELVVDQGTWTSPAWLQTDRVALDRIEAYGGCGWQGSRLEFEPTEIRTSIGGGKLQGFCDVSEWQAWWLEESDQIFESSGEIEIGPVLAMLPQTLKVREGVSMSRGNLAWTTHSRREAAGRRLLVDLRTTPMTLSSAEQSIPWETPFLASFAVAHSSSGPVLEFINVQGPAVAIEGQGSLTAGAVSIRGDLGGLYQPIAQLVDLGVTQCAGGVEGTIEWGPNRERTAQGTPSAVDAPGIGFGGDLRLTGIDVQSATGPLLQDPEVTLGFGGRWVAELPFPSSLRPFWARVDAQQDQLAIQTSQMTADGVQGQVAINGSIGRWLARLGLNPLLPGHTLAGDLQAQGNLQWNPRVVEISQLTYAIRDVRFEGPDMRLREPEVNGDVHVIYEVATGSARIERATMAGSALSASLGQFRLFGPAESGAIGGPFAIRANLEPLMAFFPSWQSSGMRMTGALEGNGAVYQAADGKLAIEQHATVNAWSLGWASSGSGLLSRAADSSWREDLLRIDFVGAFEPQSGRLSISQGALDGTGQKLDLKGSMALYDGRWPANLEGELTMRRHDWVALLRPWIGDDAELTGVHSRVVSTHGPMIIGSGTEDGPTGHWPPRALRSSAAIAWDSGKVLGIPFGAGELQANLNEKVLDFGNFNLPLGSGNLHLVSRVSFERATPRLVIDEGRVLENVELTPEACRQWVMYTAPIFATATSVRGAVDLDLKASEFPLDNPLLGTGSGTIHIKEAAIGPGPMIEQLLSLVRAIRSLGGAAAPNGTPTQWAMLPEQQVQFRMENGRVFHDRLMASAGDVAWYTSGSVGADQTIDLVAVIPVQDSWVANRPQLSALKGLEIRVPIRGSLTRPQVDSQVLTQLGRQLAEQAAGRLIDEQIQRGIGRLFGGQQ